MLINKKKYKKGFLSIKKALFTKKKKIAQKLKGLLTYKI